MQTSNERGVIVPSATVEIAPAYNKARAHTANHYKVMVAFVKAQMQRDIDYGVIPGTRKPTLLKPGAEKIYDNTNTICKMAQKRAKVAAVLSSCGASEFFTQDLDN
ncbi:MAG: hypothetical protein AB4038_12990 [Prochloraceae cyanobacterium]